MVWRGVSGVARLVWTDKRVGGAVLLLAPIIVVAAMAGYAEYEKALIRNAKQVADCEQHCWRQWIDGKCRARPALSASCERRRREKCKGGFLSTINDPNLCPPR